MTITRERQPHCPERQAGGRCYSCAGKRPHKGLWHNNRGYAAAYAIIKLRKDDTIGISDGKFGGEYDIQDYHTLFNGCILYLLFCKNAQPAQTGNKHRPARKREDRICQTH